MNDTTPLLHIEDLRKTYRGKHPVVANAGISLSACPKELVVLLGHNGAGKSTLVNQIVGLVRPDSGRIRLRGIDVVAHPELARRLVSVQAQANTPITGLTPKTAIELVGRIRGLKKAQARARANELIAELALEAWADVPAQKVSGGVARLTAFAMAAAAPGDLVILDEPTNDVDPARRKLLWAAIRALADDGRTVLLVTHNVAEVEQVADRLIILDQGRTLAIGSPLELRRSFASTSNPAELPSLEEVYLRLVGAVETQREAAEAAA